VPRGGEGGSSKKHRRQLRIERFHAQGKAFIDCPEKRGGKGAPSSLAEGRPSLRIHLPMKKKGKKRGTKEKREDFRRRV